MNETTAEMSNDSRWTPALRRAVMRVRPELFRWTSAQRERYGLAVPEADAAEIDRFLQKELFGFAQARDDLDGEQLNRFNAAILPLCGVGEDCFYLNEWLGDGITLLDFETVRDYDHDDFLFQEKCRREEDAGYVGEPYRGTLYFRWARLFVDQHFTYASLSMAAGFLLGQLEEQAHETMDALIPHRIVPGAEHGKREGEGYAWDMRVDADGKEAVFDDLQALAYDYEHRRYGALADLWDRKAHRGVFVRRQEIPGEVNADFAFTDKTALEAVRFRSFVRDCRAIERPFGELDRAAHDERSYFDSYLRTEHERLLKEFDPNVVRLRKRRKVIIHKDAADKLL
jgi:hypothetical protein